MKLITERMKKAMLLIVFAVVVWWVFYNSNFIGTGVSILLGLLSPFIIGLVLAFIFNKPMSFIEDKLFSDNNLFGKLKDKYKRPASFLITMLSFIIIITVVLFLIIPNLVEAGKEVGEKLPEYWGSLQELAKSSTTKFPQVNEIIQDINFEEVNDNIFTFIKGGFTDWLGSTFTVFSSVIGGIASVGLGIVFSIYFLLQKEELLVSLNKFIHAVLKPKHAEKIEHVAKITQESFSQFLTGQTLDALALGAMFLVVMLIFKFPYALMVSVIITITAFVPVVGAFVGLIIGAFVIFMEDPKMAGFFILLFFILQQLESNLIYPKVVGKASGLSSVWILAAITLGGSLMGILGIILFVPLFSVIQKLLQEFINRRLEEKNVFLE